MCTVSEVCNADWEAYKTAREGQCPDMTVLYAHIITVSANSVINLWETLVTYHKNVFV